MLWIKVEILHHGKIMNEKKNTEMEQINEQTGREEGINDLQESEEYVMKMKMSMKLP